MNGLGAWVSLAGIGEAASFKEGLLWALALAYFVITAWVSYVALDSE